MADLPTNTTLVKKVQEGKATLADLTGGGATQLARRRRATPGYPANFPTDGNWTPVLGSSPPSPGVYAVSVPGVPPSALHHLVPGEPGVPALGQAAAHERRVAGRGGRDARPGHGQRLDDCNVALSRSPCQHGLASNCKSSWGVFDMVGNVDEWVADWADRANGCTNWTSQTGIAGGDESCVGGNGSLAVNQIPGALIRGGALRPAARPPESSR